ncbi:Oligopeptide transport system permease protein [Anopheles sinensis]|uniref:Oligopeptide transport system permease protein n=1 Tax=Anopheles sinensis TaxID=74873 RepID=A0A084VQA3_ANOSI|nr:Oligopeptide transport system permease protein [Anopheles sinensis]
MTHQFVPALRSERLLYRLRVKSGEGNALARCDKETCPTFGGIELSKWRIRVFRRLPQKLSSLSPALPFRRRVVRWIGATGANERLGRSSDHQPPEHNHHTTNTNPGPESHPRAMSFRFRSSVLFALTKVQGTAPLLLLAAFRTAAEQVRQMKRAG